VLPWSISIVPSHRHSRHNSTATRLRDTWNSWTRMDSDTSSVAHLFVDSTPDVRSRIICRDSSCLNFLQRTKTSRCSSCSPPRSRQIPSTWSYSCTMSSRSVHFSLFAQHSSCRRVQQTMMDPRRVSQHYDIIIDLSGFAAGSQPPVQWLKFITEITPSDLRARKRSIYFLNMNSGASVPSKDSELVSGCVTTFLGAFPAH
jgi:hypothetical protein